MEDSTAGRWLDVNTAAEELGVSTDAVRKRISRGTLRSDRKDGAVQVWLDEGGTEAGREAQVEGDRALVESLQDQVAYLRSQLDAERKANEENRRLLAGLIERVPALEAPASSPASSQTSEEATEESAGKPPGSAPRTDGEGAQNGSAHVPWWRRIFGEGS